MAHHHGGPPDLWAPIQRPQIPAKITTRKVALLALGVAEYNICMQCQYIAIDLKSFYASVECVGRGLDSLTAQAAVVNFTNHVL